MITTVVYCAFILLMLFFSAFFSGSEMAFTSASEFYVKELAEKGNPAARCANSFLRNKERFLGTVLVGNNLVNVAMVTVAQVLLTRLIARDAFLLAWLPDNLTDNTEFLTACLITPVVLVFGEILPKAVVRNHADKFTLLVAVPMLWISKIIALPVLWLTSLSRLITRRFEVPEAKGQVTREDLKVISGMLAEQGLVEDNAAEMLQMALELHEKPVETIMVPLAEIRSLPETATIADLEQLTAETGFSRFPVYENRIDEITGVASLRQILASKKSEGIPEDILRKMPLSLFMERDVLFVPESKPISELLFELRQRVVPMVAVVDEYGGKTGIVTISDLAEQIVGSIRQERDQNSPFVQQIDENTFQCDGRLDIRDLEEQLGCRIPNVGFETAAGLVMKMLGRIPRVGESITYRGVTIQVLEMKRHRICRLEIRHKSGVQIEDFTQTLRIK